GTTDYPLGIHLNIAGEERAARKIVPHYSWNFVGRVMIVYVNIGIARKRKDVADDKSRAGLRDVNPAVGGHQIRTGEAAAAEAEGTYELKHEVGVTDELKRAGNCG